MLLYHHVLYWAQAEKKKNMGGLEMKLRWTVISERLGILPLWIKLKC